MVDGPGQTDNAWKVSAEVFEGNGYNFDLKNPRAPERLEHLPPHELAESILTKEAQITDLVRRVRELINQEQS